MATAVTLVPPEEPYFDLRLDTVRQGAVPRVRSPQEVPRRSSRERKWRRQARVQGVCAVSCQDASRRRAALAAEISGLDFNVLGTDLVYPAGAGHPSFWTIREN